MAKTILRIPFNLSFRGYPQLYRTSVPVINYNYCKVIAASAAATVKISIVKIWPIMSPEKIEKENKLILTANKISSIDIKITITFFLFKKIPITPKKKIMRLMTSSDLNQSQSSIQLLY